MKRWRASLSLAVTGVLVAGALGTSPARASETGEWFGPFSEGGKYDAAPPDTKAEATELPTAVSLAVLPDGNVVFWNGLQDIENAAGPLGASLPPDQTSKTRTLDLSDYFSNPNAQPGDLHDDFAVPDPEDGGSFDLFCSDQRLLDNGKVIAVGGTWWNNEDAALTNGTPLEGFGRSELYGAKASRLYDPAEDKWTVGPDMFKGRWYPTMITLGDGRLLVAGGVERLIHNSKHSPGAQPPDNDMPENVYETEIYDPDSNTFSTNTTPESEQSLPLYPRLRLMPNGKVFYDASGQMWGPFGEDVNQMGWNHQKWFDPATMTWSDGPVAPLGARNGSFSIMLPLRPDANGNYSQAQILQAGGTLLTSPGGLVATPLSELITVEGDEVTRDLTAGQMNTLRWFSSGVGLPTGEVLAFNGADLDEVIYPGIERAVRLVEMYDPATGTWKALSNSQRDRTYHNSAVLLKDGSVLVGGHAPINHGYGNEPQPPTPLNANNFKDPSFEIFKPPYLFRGERPVITNVPGGASRGANISIVTPNAQDETLKVALVRTPQVTHVTEADQRTVWVDHTVLNQDTISLELPGSGSVLPDGYYYVFLMKDNGEGLTPSVAEIIKIKN